MPDVDVAINYFGKPYQTLVTLASLIEHSGPHVGKIYLIKEPQQPHDGHEIDLLLERHDWPIEVYQPQHYIGWEAVHPAAIARDEAVRLSIRYQYALEQTERPYLFISHNDVRYEADLVGALLDAIEGLDVAGAGRIAQCWNCPPYWAGLCDGSRYHEVALSQAEAVRLYEENPVGRPGLARFIDPESPMPLPECRLNEMACLLDVAIYRKETFPAGDSLPFGSSTFVDTGCAWFHSMVRKGYRFAHLDAWGTNAHPSPFATHAWADTTAQADDREAGGHQALFDRQRYDAQERLARDEYHKRWAPK